MTGKQRGVVRQNQFERDLEFFNAEIAGKTSRVIAEYHERYIGTSPLGPTIEERLRLLERTSIRWWIITPFLWLRDWIRHKRAERRGEAVPCRHEIEELAASWDEPSLPCQQCGMMLRIPVPDDAA